jgi:electron transfer flavoprotein alpha/beta subunit
MLNIKVLVKSIWDPTSIQWDYRHADLDYLSLTFNKTDMHALQWACDYKSKYGANIEVLLVLRSGLNHPLERLTRLPIDQIKILEASEACEHPEVIASLLAEEITRSSFDLILSGSESEDIHSGTTPIILAELLKIPCMAHVYAIEENGGGRWQVHRKEGRGIVHSFQIHLPALIGVERSIAPLRYFPRSLSDDKKPEMINKQISWQIPLAAYTRVKLTEPKPVIRYMDVPHDELAQHRLLKVTGLGQEHGLETDKIKNMPSAAYTHFIAQKIESWLKE